MTTPYKCPICGGSGKVPFNFYKDRPSTSSTISINYEECRSCGGKGVIWDYSDNYKFDYSEYKPKNDSTTYYSPCDNCNVRLSSNFSGFCNCVLPYFVNPTVRW